MRQHRPDCPTADEIEAKLEKKIKDERLKYTDKATLEFNGNDLVNLRKVIGRIVRDLGPLAKDWGMVKEFQLHEAECFMRRQIKKGLLAYIFGHSQRSLSHSVQMPG